MTSTPIVKALLYRDTGNGSPGRDSITVQFNPTSLSYSVQNKLDKKSRDANAQQFVAQSTAKLDFELIFDSTHDGKDVRIETRKLKQFLNPAKTRDKAPAVVGFSWGTFKFSGIIESFKETLDFFSSDGVPLRSTVKMGLSAQDAKAVFTDEPLTRGAAGMDTLANTRIAPVPPGGTTEMGTRGGNARAGRGLAGQNGFENMRLPGSAFAAIPPGDVQLKDATAFSSGSPGGLDLGGALGAVSGTLGAVGAAVGAASSAAANTLDAFAGLSAAAASVPRSAALDLSSFDVKMEVPAASAQFALGGQVVAPVSSGLRTDVGISARIRFD